MVVGYLDFKTILPLVAIIKTFCTNVKDYFIFHIREVTFLDIMP